MLSIMFQNNDTIFALSSGNPPAGVAVIRISGAGLTALWEQITNIENPTPRRMYFVRLPEIDDVLAVYFRAPNSFTGEDVIEIHSHGSVAVIEKIFRRLESFGARLAQRGEFSARAFLNGKMDLQQVDGLADLIHAKTEQQRAAALSAYAGTGSALYKSWRDALVLISANLAAAAEFPPEELPGGLVPAAREQVKKLLQEIENVLGTYAVGRAIRSGFRIVLAGDVNAGKSSLFNAMLGKSRAIVSDVPGTTRDFISAELDIGGYLVELIDTAGLRDTTDAVEQIGVLKSRDLASAADLVISVINPASDAAPVSDFVVKTHGDLHPEIIDAVSVKTGQNMDALISRIKDEIARRLTSQPVMVSNENVRGLLRSAADFLIAADAENVPELVAENVRLASDEIGKVIGDIDFDEIQSAIFGRLCLGK